MRLRLNRVRLGEQTNRRHSLDRVLLGEQTNRRQRLNTFRRCRQKGTVYGLQGHRKDEGNMTVRVMVRERCGKGVGKGKATVCVMVRVQVLERCGQGYGKGAGEGIREGNRQVVVIRMDRGIDRVRWGVMEGRGEGAWGGVAGG